MTIINSELLSGYAHLTFIAGMLILLTMPGIVR